MFLMPFKALCACVRLGDDDMRSREGTGRVADELCSGKGEGRLPGLGVSHLVETGVT